MTKDNIIAGLFIALGLFLLVKGLTDPVLMGPGGGLLMLGLAYHQGHKIPRCIGAGVLAMCGAFWLPGIIEDPSKYALLGLIAFVFIGASIRVGILRGTA